MLTQALSLPFRFTRQKFLHEVDCVPLTNVNSSADRATEAGVKNFLKKFPVLGCNAINGVVDLIHQAP